MSRASHKRVTGMQITHIALLIAIATLSAAVTSCDGTVGGATPMPHARSLSLGSESSCMLERGVVSCWGEGGEGELGDGFGSDRLFPRPIALTTSGGGLGTVAMGGGHACAIHSTGALYCWGQGGGGGLGTGGLLNGYTPRATDTLNGTDHSVRLISAGGYHSCAVTERNALYCWGYSGHGQLGTGDIDGDGMQPMVVSPKIVPQHNPDDEIVSLAAGGYHTCVAYSDGRAACWGRGADGQRGDACLFGSETDQACAIDHATPTAIPYFDLSNPERHAISVFAGDQHTCVVSKNGHLFCFGLGSDGRLGGNDNSSHSTPQHVGNIPAPVRSVAVGDAHTCALLANEEIYCFGDNAMGQLGNGSTTDSAIPVKVALSAEGNAKMVGVAAGAAHSCAWDTARQYYCWGGNGSGQLGLGVQGGIRVTPEAGVY